MHGTGAGEGGFTQEVLAFNDTGGEGEGLSEDTEAFLAQLLKLVHNLVVLEEVIARKRFEEGSRPQAAPPAPSGQMRYQPELALAEQPMFLAAVLAALRGGGGLHSHWTGLVVASLPFLGPSLTLVVTAVASQLWTGLEQLPSLQAPVASDQVLGLLEALGQLLSYCLLDSAPGAVSAFPSSPAQPSSATSLMEALSHVLGGDPRPPGGQVEEQLASARRALLSLTPRLLVAVCALWRGLQHPAPPWLLGCPRPVRSTLLALVSPLATVHSSSFLAAVGVAWAEQGPEGRAVLVEVVAAVRTFPTPTLIGTLRQVVKSPPPVLGLKPGTSLHLATLQFFSSYLAASPAGQLQEAWSGLRELLKDCCSLAPPSLLLGLSLLHQFVVRGGAKELEKKEAREVQELATKLVEAASGVAGSRLEAGTWLRASRGVRQEEVEEPDHAVPALSQLAAQLATVVDIVWQSEEKDRVLPLLTTVMYNLVPYLRHHVRGDLPLLRCVTATYTPATLLLLQLVFPQGWLSLAGLPLRVPIH